MSPIRDVGRDERLEPTAPFAVVIPMFGAHDLFVRCLRSVLAHTPQDVPVVVADDADPDPASRRFAETLDASNLHWLRQPENLGYVGNCNAAMAACAPADVVLVNSDCEVATGWLEGLRDAATSDHLIASASAMSNHATILSVPERNVELPRWPSGVDFERAAAALRDRSPRLRPRIPTAIGHCVYVRRSALDLVGGFDCAFAPAYGEEVDWSQRATLNGLVHVCAEDVLVTHRGRGSLHVRGAANPLQQEHKDLIAGRYPYHESAVADAAAGRHSPLASAISVARRALLGLSVTIDARLIGPAPTGTEMHIIELVRALARRPELRLRVVVSEGIPEYAHAAFEALPSVDLKWIGDVFAAPPNRTEVVHRPYQAVEREDIAFLRRLGERLIITQLDLIAYRNPSCHGSTHDWQRYRDVTRLALSAADAVVFPSDHAKADAEADDLAGAGRSVVCPLGIDHGTERGAEGEASPPGLGRLDDERPFLLCLGTDFRHKNRVWAIRLFEALVERGWDGRLVLAGPSVSHGSSVPDERALLVARPALADAVVRLGPVSEDTKLWLYRHAAAVLYPSLNEGFGLIPFEAARQGTPCVWPPVAAMAETLAGIEAPLVPWDVEASADRVLPLLVDPAVRGHLVAAIEAAGSRLTWDRHAERLQALYEEVLLRPERHGAWLAERCLEAEATRFGVIGYGRLASRRALAALRGRPVTARPLRAALRLAHRRRYP